VIDDGRVFEKETDCLSGTKRIKPVEFIDMPDKKRVQISKEVVPKRYWIENPLEDCEIVVSYDDTIVSGKVTYDTANFEDEIIGKIDTKENKMEHLTVIIVDVDTDK